MKRVSYVVLLLPILASLRQIVKPFDMLIYCFYINSFCSRTVVLTCCGSLVQMLILAVCKLAVMAAFQGRPLN